MATQDESGGFNLGQAALGVLAGAAAGSQSGDIGGGFLGGLQAQQSLEDRRQKSERVNQQVQRQQTQDAQRTRAANLSAERQQQAIDATQRDSDLRDFDTDMQIYGKLGQQSVLDFQKSYAAGAVRARSTDGTMTYGLTEEQAIEVDTHTRASKTMSDTQMYLSALEKSLTSTNPNEFAQADKMQRILGVGLGFNFIPESDGVPAQIQTPWGAFPAEMESARKIMDRAQEESFAARKHYETSRRMKSDAHSGATRTMFKHMEGMGSLNSKEASGIAEAYTNQIMGNDMTARTHQLAHGMDFILGNKGGDMTQGEKVILSDLLDKHNVGYRMDKDGEVLIKAEDVNRYVNRYLPEEQQKTIIDSNGWVPVDDQLVQSMYGNSGVTAIRDRWSEEAQRLNDRNRGNAEKQFMVGLNKERIKDVHEAQTKEGIEQAKITTRANNLDPKLSIDETIENIQIPALVGDEKFKLADNPQLVDGLRFEASTKAMQEAVRGKNTKQFEKEYKDTFGRDLNADLAEDSEDFQKEAIRFMRERGKIEIDPKRVDFFMREGMKDLKTKSGIKSLLKRMDAKTRGPREKATKNQAKQKKSDAITSKILGGTPGTNTPTPAERFAGEFEKPGTGFRSFNEE